MRISDWSSDVCSSDLNVVTISTTIGGVIKTLDVRAGMTLTAGQTLAEVNGLGTVWLNAAVPEAIAGPLKPGQGVQATLAAFPGEIISGRVAVILPETQADSSEEHTSELQSLMRTSYAVFCLKKKNNET